MFKTIAKIFSQGTSARELLANEAFRAAFSDLREELVSELLATKAKDADVRERIYLSIRCLDSVAQKLSSYVSDMEAEQIKSQNEGMND